MGDRLETGVMTPDGDWPGIFIRGDNALGYAANLRAVYALAEQRAKEGSMRGDEAMIWSHLKGLTDLLGSCRVGAQPNQEG